MHHLRAAWQRFRLLQISFLVVGIFLAGFALGSQYNVSQAQSDLLPPAGSETLFAPFWQVYNLITTEYLEPVEPETLVNGAIQGMMNALGDQFSGYMNPEMYPLMNADLSGAVEGIGALVETIEETGAIRIASVLEGSPAEAAGIQDGDIFIEVNGEDVTGLSQMELVIKVRGPAGTVVNLTMQRGDQLLEFSVTRARIEVPNIEYKILDNNIGYVKMRDFSADARTKLDGALQALDVNQLDGLIFDLRGNPGGLLSTAIEIASAFIKDGTILIEDFGRGEERVFEASGSYIGVSVPLVLLVDEDSASASELVAGALQDRGRAKIIGETTFGKGTVQTWRELVNGGGVRLTIARWLTPNRSWIHDVGITPDIVVEWTPEVRNDPNDPQLKAALDYLLTLQPASLMP
ncbi:MAG: S41 family peptidase [Chloroflexi bacterium]|nr:S41 family peptidase [Chloroflexota bacterium]MDL1884723.1 S41 family peptidase [Anaerolineae bacterium CFX8]